MPIATSRLQPVARGNLADQMAAAMSSDDFRKAFVHEEAVERENDFAPPAQLRKRGNVNLHITRPIVSPTTLHEPLDRMIAAVHTAKQQHPVAAPKKQAQKQQQQQQEKPDELTELRTATRHMKQPADRVMARMSTDAFAKAVRDSEKAENLEEARHKQRFAAGGAAGKLAAAKVVVAPRLREAAARVRHAEAAAVRGVVPVVLRAALGRLASRAKRALRLGLAALKLQRGQGVTAARESANLIDRIRSTAARATNARPRSVMPPAAAAATALALVSASMIVGNFGKNLELPRAAAVLRRAGTTNDLALRGLHAVRDAVGGAPALSRVPNPLQMAKTAARNLFGPAAAARMSTVAAWTGLGESNTDWFYSLNRPVWLLPRPIIGMVWTALYCCMAAAMYRLLVRPSLRAADRTRAIGLWCAQLAFATLWGLALFALRSPALGTVHAIAYFCLVAAATRACAAFDRRAGRLMLPMVLWVGLCTIPTGAALMLKN